jgi:hypothetical protein
MSVGRIGARAGVIAAGVLASVALMAAPSWANGVPNPNPTGGNREQAHECQGTITTATGVVEKWKTLTNPMTGGKYESHDECVFVLADKLK